MYTHYNGTSGVETVRLSQEAVDACSHSGDCAADVAYWVDKVEWLASREQLVEHLVEYGAWEDLNEVDLDTLRERALWLAAGEISEEPEHYEEEE